MVRYDVDQAPDIDVISKPLRGDGDSRDHGFDSGVDKSPGWMFSDPFRHFGCGRKNFMHIVSVPILLNPSS